MGTERFTARKQSKNRQNVFSWFDNFDEVTENDVVDYAW